MLGETSYLLAGPEDWSGLARLLEGRTPDLLVVVEAPVDELMRRLEVRPSQHSRTQRLVADRRAAELERGRLLLDRIVATMPCDRFTVVNDGSVPAEDLCRPVSEWVLRAV